MPTPQEDYRTIQLNHGQTVIIDATDYEWLSRYKWFASKRTSPSCKVTYYAVRKISKKSLVNPGKTVYMHRPQYTCNTTRKGGE